MQQKLDVHAAFNLHAWCLHFLRHAPCTTKHMQSFDDITVVGKNTVTQHISTSLNYA
jgi:hypothetical protein